MRCPIRSVVMKNSPFSMPAFPGHVRTVVVVVVTMVFHHHCKDHSPLINVLADTSGLYTESVSSIFLTMSGLTWFSLSRPGESMDPGKKTWNRIPKGANSLL